MNDDYMSKDFITMDSRTSDMEINDNGNTEYLLFILAEFNERRSINYSLMELFNFEINQRVAWENVYLYGDYKARETFNMNRFEKVLSVDISDISKTLFENDSIVDAGILHISNYLAKKYNKFDFSLVEDLQERMQHFTSFNYTYKLMNIFETLLPQAIRAKRDDVLKMFDDISDVEKHEKTKDKAYLALIWNMVMSEYLSKCDKDIFDVFSIQTWDFSSEYILKNLC